MKKENEKRMRTREREILCRRRRRQKGLSCILTCLLAVSVFAHGLGWMRCEELKQEHEALRVQYEALECEVSAAEAETEPALQTEKQLPDFAALPAGTILSEAECSDRCVSELFQSVPIPEEVRERINGKSYRENPDISLAELRYLKVAHYNFGHQVQVGELIVHELLAQEILEIFQELFEKEYEIQSLVLIDDYWTGDGAGSDAASVEANNSSAFCYRTIAGSDTLSNHAFGSAIDINPQQNPYVSFAEGVPSWEHENAAPYIDRTSGAAHMITRDDDCCRIFSKHGFIWGGDWENPKDYQHFEYPREALEQLGRERAQESGSTEDILSSMTTKEKVAQLFMVLPEALTGADLVTAAGEVTREALQTWPVGGIVYLEGNIQSEAQFAQMTSQSQTYSRERIGLPLLIGVDEEGGTVRRISGRGFPEVPEIPDMYRIGSAGDEEQARRIGREIGSYLKRFGVNVDFAPVADIWTNPENTVIGTRSFGTDAALVAEMVSAQVRGLKEQGVCAALKHFPGHGDTAQDSHTQAAVSRKTLEELRSCEWLPFQAGIEAGAELVMVGHIALPEVTGEDTLSSLSHTVVTELLREELGFDGVVVTDAMNMGAVTGRYDSGTAAVAAIQAGVDLVLMPADFQSAYQAVLDAVQSGGITKERLDQSVGRIVELKRNLDVPEDSSESSVQEEL